jgi:hypothetical protein
VSDLEVNGDNIRNVFLQTATIRPVMRLVSDAQNPMLPLQYQFLSLYKGFEFEFRIARKWIGLKEALAPYEERFTALNVGKKTIANTLHDLRDKCAHIKIGADDELGVIGLGDAAAKRVALALPLFREVILTHISAKYAHLDLKFAPPLGS